MPEEIETADKVGSVSNSRYEQIVADLRKVVEAQGKGQFMIGDGALEIEPMREQYAQGERSEGLFTVKESVFRLAEDIGLAYKTVSTLRWVASRWPKEHRQDGVSFTVHRILARIEDEEERFAAILTPPKGKARWTPDEANRRVGWQVTKPVTPQEKVSAIHSLAQDEEVAAVVTGDLLRRPDVVAQVKAEDKVRVVEELTRDDQVAAAVAPEFLRRLAVVAKVTQADRVKVVQELTRDEQVAAVVTTGLLRRPDVAFRAMSDDTARHQVNSAQVERGRQAREQFEQTSPVAPAIRRIDRSLEFLDLVTACHAFVAAAGRAVPGLRDRQLSADEKAIVHERVAACRATLDWIETAVDTGKVDVDGELARLLQGE
ncbi:DUF6192 family protein [Kitasatospora sp. NPDC088783]|uniref:DUF6192 family protein n=1 Tax=Kitasatospora sp. NPDC088783 TaxID=3364077 RepID=UPI00380CCEE6